MTKFIIVAWEDETSGFYREDKVVVKGGRAVMKQFGKRMFEGKILSYHSTKASARQELAETTEVPRDVSSVMADDGKKRERKMTRKMEEFAIEQSISKDATPAISAVAKIKDQTQAKTVKGVKKPRKTKSTTCIEKEDQTKPKKTKTGKDIVQDSVLRRVADELMSSEMDDDNDPLPILKPLPTWDSTSNIDTDSTTPKPRQDTQQTHRQDTQQTPRQDTQQTLRQDTQQTPRQDTQQTPRQDTQQTHRQDTQQTSRQDTQTPRQDTQQTPRQDTQQTHRVSTPQSNYFDTYSYDILNTPSQQTGESTIIGDAVSLSLNVQEESFIARPKPQYSCQSCYQLKSSVESLQQQVFQLSQSCYNLNTRLYQIEQHMSQVQSAMPNPDDRFQIFFRIDRNHQLKPIQVYTMDSQRSSSFTTVLAKAGRGTANGSSEECLLWMSSGAVQKLEDMEKTKKKKTGHIRPPLEDQAKLRVLYDIIVEKYPGRMPTDINLVLSDVVKPSASGMM